MEQHDDQRQWQRLWGARVEGEINPALLQRRVAVRIEVVAFKLTCRNQVARGRKRSHGCGIRDFLNPDGVNFSGAESWRLFNEYNALDAHLDATSYIVYMITEATKYALSPRYSPALENFTVLASCVLRKVSPSNIPRSVDHNPETPDCTAPENANRSHPCMLPQQ